MNDELDDFFSMINTSDNSNVRMGGYNPEYSLDEMYSRHYSGSLSRTYLQEAIEVLPSYDIVNFIVNLVEEIKFLDSHMRKETLNDSEKEEYELKLQEKRNRIRVLNNQIIDLNESISNLEAKVYKLKQNKRIIYKAASRINQKHVLVDEVDKVIQEEANEDHFKVVFDKFENELKSRRLAHKNIIDK